MTPDQITIVERTLERLHDRLQPLAQDFYARLFAAEPHLGELFTTEPDEQCRKFADQLELIGCAIRDCDRFIEDAAALGVRHRTYGVRAHDYALAGPPLLAALAAALGPDWNADVEEAWSRAYNLTVEAMMAGASAHPPDGVRPR
jgi:hemoglobin-like flavoprotein